MPRPWPFLGALLLLLWHLNLASSDVNPTTKVISTINPTFIGPKRGLLYGQSEGVDGPEGNQTNFVAGAVNRILAHPTDPNILYVGTVNGGVWKTIEAQKRPSWNVTWTPLTDKYGLLAIAAMQFDYSDPTFNTIIASIGGVSSYHRAAGLVTGVLVTKDGGKTWDATDSEYFDNVRLKGAHSNGNIIVVCGESTSSIGDYSGTFLSVDAGRTYRHTDTAACRDMLTDYTNPDIVYKALPSMGIMQSVDSGKTWKAVTSKSPTQGWSSGKYRGKKLKNMRITLWTDGNHTIIYAGLLGEDLVGLIRGDYNTTAQTWEWQSLPLPFTMEAGDVVGLNPTEDPDEEEGGGQGDIHFSITVDKNDPDVVYLGGDRQPTSGKTPAWPNSIGAKDYSGRLFRYRVGDAAAIPITHNFTRGSAPHADSRHLTMDALGNLLESDDGGIYILTNTSDGEGKRWQSLNGNLAVLEAHSVRYVDGLFVTGNQDTGTSFGGPNGFWTSFQKGDGGVVRVAKSDTFTRICSSFLFEFEIFESISHFLLPQVDFSFSPIEDASYYRLGSFGYFSWRGPKDYNRVYTDNIIKEDGYRPYDFNTWCRLDFYQTYSTHATDAKRLAIPCPSEFSIVETKDAGNNWAYIAPYPTPVFTGGFLDVIYGGKLDGKIHSNVLVGLASRALFARGPTDSYLTQLPSWRDSGYYASAIAMASDANAYTRLWILLDSRQIIYTDDFAESFSLWGGYIPIDSADAEDAKLLRIPGDHLFLYGRFGLLWLAPGQRSWSVVRGGVPNGYIPDVGYEPKEDMLYFSAFGRGIYALRGATAILSGIAPPVAAPTRQPVAPPRAKPPTWALPPYSGWYNPPTGGDSVYSPSRQTSEFPWLFIGIIVGVVVVVLVLVITVSVICCRDKSKGISSETYFNHHPPLSPVASSMSSMQSYGYAPLSNDESPYRTYNNTNNGSAASMQSYVYSPPMSDDEESRV